jgi:signal transduction histidine kinase
MHLLAMAVQVGVTVFGIWAVGPALPVGVRDLLIGLLAVLLILWIGLIAVWARVRHPSGERLIRWRRANWLITWLGNLANIAGYWIAMPYASDALVLLFSLFAYGTVTVQVLGSIQRPPAREGWVLTPLALPASVMLYWTLHWDPYSLALISYSAVYAAVMMELRRVVQRAVNRAHAAQAAAEAAHDSKTRFLTSASHDLGQPLQAARLSLDQLLRSPDPGQRDRAARRMGWALDTTERLLTGMLDHLRLDAGAVEPRIEPVALGPLIARIAELHEPAARLAGVAVHAMPSRLTALADAALVERAVGNFVGNSLRHAKARRVLVGARRCADRIRLWVIDDGVGVAAADAPHLFEDYVQGGHGDEVRGGFGLGLASARRMAGLMEGAAGFDGKWRKGAAFWLELRAAQASAP